MPIDAGIYANLLRGPKSVEEYDNEANAARGNALQLQQQRMQMNALQQQQQDDQALRNYLAGNVKLDTPEGQAGLYRVAPKAAGGILKSQAEIAQANAAAKKDAEQGGKAAQEKVGEAMKNSRYNLEGVTTPEQYIAWHEQNHKDPVLGPYLASRGVTADQARARISEMLQKPGGFEQLVNESKLGAEKAYENAMKQQEFGLRANNELIGQDGKINQTLLGAKKQVAQAGAPVQSSVTYQVDGQGNLVALPTKIPNGSGSVSSVPVMSGGKPVQGSGGKGGGNATEGERKAGTLLARLRGSQQQLTQALSDDPGAAKPGIASEGLRATLGDTAANLAMGQGRQRVEAAQLDMLDAALTLGTGAAYTKEQLRGYARSYFPQIGDDAKTVSDKKARLDNVIQAAEIAAGRAADLVKTPSGAPTKTANGATVSNW